MELSEKQYFRKAAFGERLAQARTRLKLSQEALAEAVGTTARSISRWEHNQAIPQQYYRERLCEVLQITPEALFAENNEKQQGVEKQTPLWHVPYPRNPYFTGREDILYQLHERLHQEHQIALTQPQIMSGLGGIGKTQTALEYLYRFRDDYQTVLWVGAETPEILMTDYRMLAHLFQLPEKDSSDQILLREAIKRWFHSHTNWLLVFDNVEDMEQLHIMLPDTRQGHILITTRSQIAGSLGFHIDLQKMEPAEGALFLLRRARLLHSDAALEDAPSSLLAQANTLVELLDGLPLALDQAGAYIEETACSLSDYLERYATRRTVLLSTRGTLSNHHPDSVATTLALAIQQVEQRSPAAADLLSVCAFLHAEAIPEALFIQFGGILGPNLQSVTLDPLLLDTTIRDLRRFSLIYRESEIRTLSLHRLLQVIIRERTNEDEREQWTKRILQVMLQIFPNHKDVKSYDFGHQSDRQQYLPHVLTFITLLKEWKVILPEAGELLYRVAHYLQQSWGSNQQALPLLRQAVDLAQQTLGKEHATTALYLHALGIVSTAEKLYEQAEESLQQALEIRKKIRGPDHSEVAETLEKLANLACWQGLCTQAFFMTQQALSIKERALGEDHYEVALTLNTLGSISMYKNEYSQAEQCFQRALSISEKAIGSDHLFIAFFSRSLGSLYFIKKQYDQALNTYQQALRIFEQKLAPDHPFTASVLVKLGDIFFAQQHYQRAKIFYQKAAKMFEKHLVPDTSQLAYCQLRLGELYFVQEDERLTKYYLQRAFFILGETSPELHIDYQGIIHYHLLFADKVRQGNLMQAYVYYQQALAMGEQWLESEHPLIIHCRNTIKTLLH